MQSEEQELGHYQLRRLLGEGGFGEVYEAWDSKLHRSIAIKRLKPKMLSSRPETLLDEARMAASLRHPAFVKIFSIDGDADQQSIIMEYVDGNTLRKMGEGEPLSEAAALDIVAQVAEAMQEAHASQLIHGDLKPSNLMLEASGTVRIMDFGLARRIDPQSTESVVLDDAQGTIAYLAPELLTGTRPNEKSDVYSLGVVLYEMVTGGRPFPHLNGLALAAAYMQSSSAAWPFPAHLNPAIGALVRAMTDRNLGERLPSMHAVRERIAAIQGGSAPGAARVSPAAAAGGRLRPIGALLQRQRFPMLAAAALSIACLVGYGMALSLRQPAEAPVLSAADLMKTGMASLTTFDRDDSIERAIQSFTAVLANNPNHAAAAAGLSRAYSLRYAGDKRDPVWLQRADASAQRALQLNDQLAMAHAAQGAVRYQQGRPDEALGFLDQALRLDPRQAVAPLVKSAVLLQQRKFAQAEQVLAEAMKLHPTDRTFIDQMGSAKFAQADYPAAEQYFRQSIRVEPDVVMAYSNLSLTLQHQNREGEALQVLQQGLQVRPATALYQSLGTVLFSRGEYLESAKAFERTVTGGGANNYLNWANLGDTLRWIPGREKDSQSAYRDAVSRLRPLLEKSPGDPTLNSRLGVYLARLGDRAGANQYTKAAIAAGPAVASVRFRAAMAYEIMGERDSALAELAAAVERKYPSNLINTEPDLVALRSDPRFRQPTPESQ